ncbi:MAG: deoxyribose-phosphate aldolase [Rikenellaceae bacterium]
MEYSELLKSYSPPSCQSVESDVARFTLLSKENLTEQVARRCLSCTDLTTLSCADSAQSVEEFARRAADFQMEYPSIEGVASVCVYPSFVETVGVAVDGTSLKITSVAGGFPSSQTFLEVKALECAMAVESGADEVDVVLNVGEILTSNYDQAASEMALLREEVGEDATLKVIIESGELDSVERIHSATLLSIMAGADFVKTSTGKVCVAATPQAAVVMCSAIKEYYQATGKMVGFKVAGGVRTMEDAALYYTIVEGILGEEWLTPSLFRIGASSLANELLSTILGEPTLYF